MRNRLNKEMIVKVMTRGLQWQGITGLFYHVYMFWIEYLAVRIDRLPRPGIENQKKGTWLDYHLDTKQESINTVLR